MARVSVVIPCFNAARTLPDCLAALRAQASPPLEIIVVDDRSTDDSPGIAARLGARVLRSDRKLQAGGARAAGVAAASGDAVVFVDADMVLAPRWLADARAALDRDPTLAAVGGSVEPPGSGNLCEWADYFMSFSAYMPSLPPSKRLFLPTNGMLVRREPLDGARFRESYGDEDTDFSFQLVDRGFSLLFNPQLRAEHLGWRGRLRDLAREQRRYAVGFVSGRGRVDHTKRLLALPWIGLVPGFTILKIAQVLRRTFRTRRALTMLIVSLPIVLTMLALRAHYVSSLRHTEEARS